jgi:hypothetical protein
LQALKENNFNPKILYPAKLLFKIEGGIKIFHEKQRLRQYMKEFYTQKMKTNIAVKGW